MGKINNRPERNRNRKNLRYITIMMVAITFVVWLLLLFYKHVNGKLSFSDLLDDIIANILGILPPIIIFNFIYEYLSKEYVADAMSEQMLETLTGNTEMMGTFKKEVRQNFIKSTIKSLVGEDKLDMVYGVLDPYLDNRPYDMRLGFKYIIDLRKYYRGQEIGCEIFSPNDYYSIREKISYTKVLSVRAQSISKFSIGFFIDTVTLEKELLDKNYLFRESLKIKDQDLQMLMGFTEKQKLDFVNNCLQLQLLIDDAPAQITEVYVGDFGVSVDLIPFVAPITKNKFEIVIAFRMPQLKKRSEFLVSLTEPTFSPEIEFAFEPTISKVTPYQFLNDDSKLIKDAAALHGRVTINPSGWVYPIKGILFIIEDIDEDTVA